MTYTPPLKYPVILLLMGVICFFPFLGSAHLFDWDEINFAESAREMLITENYFRITIDFIPFTEKPPLFFWLQALSMQVFGVNEFAARLPNAIFGLLTIFTLYITGKRLMDERFGFLWALSYLGSVLPHLYFRSGIIDPVFNFFMFLGVGFLARTVYLNKMRFCRFSALFAGIFTGLAVLTKGPVGFLLVALSFIGYWAYRRFKIITNWQAVLIYALATFITTWAWYGIETLQNGPDFLLSFIQRQVEIFTTSDAGHGQPFYYHFVVLLLGCFPISILALRSFFTKGPYPGSELAHFRYWMISLFCVVLVVFSISTTKIVHYSSMAYYPLSFLAAYHVYNLSKGRWKVKKGFAIPGILVGTLLGLALMMVAFIEKIKAHLIPLTNDPFAVGNLQSQVMWQGWEWLIGLLLAVVSIWGWIGLNRGKILSSVYLMYIGVALVMLLATSFLVPKIEQYTQGANIRFFKSLQKQDVYASTLWYKSYAPLFYTQKQSASRKESRENDWLLTGAIDKPVYLSIKIQDKARMQDYPEFELLREENGFAFYKRIPKNEVKN